MKETDAMLLKRLKRPEGKIDVVLDTDTYNEIDDQFALAYLLKSGEKLNVRAIYAAPFHNEKSEGPADGMEKSFQEIQRILELMDREDMKEHVYRGSCSYLPDETQPVHLACGGASGTACHAVYTGAAFVCGGDRRDHKRGFRDSASAGDQRQNRSGVAGGECALVAG